LREKSEERKPQEIPHPIDTKAVDNLSGKQPNKKPPLKRSRQQRKHRKRARRVGLMDQGPG
jgi:hypothetical protein